MLIHLTVVLFFWSNVEKKAGKIRKILSFIWDEHLGPQETFTATLIIAVL